MKAKTIDVELIRSLLKYAPENGKSCLVWKVDKKGTKSGAIAGHRHSSGYWRVCINGVKYMAHRLVWAVVNGEDPPCQVDHIHGREAGNHIENLRLAPNGQADNAQNMKLGTANKSGHVGVYKHKNGKWVAQIRRNKKPYYLGVYKTPEEAREAYLKAKALLHTFQPF